MRATDISDDLVWRYRDRSLGSLACVVGTTENALQKALHKRGWRRVQGRGGRVCAAPCARCGQHAVPVERLDAERRCEECRYLPDVGPTPREREAIALCRAEAAKRRQLFAEWERRGVEPYRRPRIAGKHGRAA